MDNINEGSRGAARLARLQAAAKKANYKGDAAKERKISSTAAMAGGKTAVQTRMAIRGGADLKTAKATTSKSGQKKAYDKRSAAIANFAARGVARKALAQGMKKIKPKRPAMAEAYDNIANVIAEGVKRKHRLLRAKMSAKNYNDPEKRKSLETSYDSELGRRVARKLRKGGAPKRTVVKFFNKDGTTPAADKAIKKFNSREMDTVRSLRARGVKPQYDHVEHDGDAITEGYSQVDKMMPSAYQHAVKTYVKVKPPTPPRNPHLEPIKRITDKIGTKRPNMVKNSTVGKPTDKSYSIEEGSISAQKVARRLRSNIRMGDIVDRMSKLTKKRIVRAGGAEDLKVRSKNPQANVRSLNALHQFHDTARARRNRVEEAYQLKRQRVITKAIKNSGKALDPKKADFLARSNVKKFSRDEKLTGVKGDNRGSAKLANAALNVRTVKRNKALLGKGLGLDGKPMRESVQLDEAGYKKLMRMKAAAYKAGMQARGDSGPGAATKKYAKLMRRAADQETRQDAKMALRGQASQKAVERGGSIIGKRGVPTERGMKLADQRSRAIKRFKSAGSVSRYMQTGSFDGKMDKEGVAQKRQRQQAQAKFNKQARTGDLGQNNQEALRARSNFQKRYGRLKGK